MHDQHVSTLSSLPGRGSSAALFGIAPLAEWRESVRTAKAASESRLASGLASIAVMLAATSISPFELAPSSSAAKSLCTSGFMPCTPLVTARKESVRCNWRRKSGVTQKSTWFVLHRLREACSTPAVMEKLKGVVELDECFIGGKEATSMSTRSSALDAGLSAKLPCLECGNVADARSLLRWNNVICKLPRRAFTRTSNSERYLYTDEHLMFSDLDGLFLTTTP